MELMSNVPALLFPDISPSSLTNFLPEQLDLESQQEVASLYISFPSIYQNNTERKIMLFDAKLSKTLAYYNLEPSVNLSLSDFVGAMNTLIEQKHNHNEWFITVKACPTRKKMRFSVQLSDLVCLSVDLRHIFGSTVGTKNRVMLRRKLAHNPEVD